MFPTNKVLLSLICAAALSTVAEARNVFVMPPGDGVVRPVAVYTGDPFNPASASVLAAQDTFAAFSTPAGNKYYFLGRSATNTLVITDANFQVLGQRQLGTGATAAAMTPNGRYLVICAGTVQILDTSTDNIVTQLDGGASPNDVAISRDGRYAYVTSASSARLTSIDLNSLILSNSFPNLIGVGGVSVGANGLVYVSATNILYELTPELSVRGGAGIQLNAFPGKPYVLADSLGAVRVVLTNSNPLSAGGSSLLTVDMGTRTATPAFTGGVIFNSIVPVSFNRVVAISNTGQLYDAQLPSSVFPAQFSGLATTAGVRAAVASNEFPNARYLYVAFTNQVSRVDLANNLLSGSFQTTNTPGGTMSFSGAAYTGVSAASIFGFGNGQTILPFSASLPLVVRAVDNAGHPLQNVPVSWTTSGGDALMLSQQNATDAEGYAVGIVRAPTLAGFFQVIVQAGSGVVLQGQFNLTSGTGGGSGVSGAVSIRGGNGQVIRESTTTPELLRVVVRDSAGNPVPNALVNWTVTGVGTAGGGQLLALQTFTDFAGETTNTFIAPFLGTALTAYSQFTITASTATGSINMYVTVIPNLFQGQPAPGPAVQILQPSTTDTITGQAGTTVLGAIQARVLLGSTPVPNVGVRVSTGLDPTLGPTASCKDDAALTDANGIATCDLIMGSRIGTAELNVLVGGTVVSFTPLTLRITPGPPAVFTVIQGDNQSGAPGTDLPLALVASVQDSFGNNLVGAAVTWRVESGTATLFNTVGVTSPNARVSTQVRLGNTPGTVRIRVFNPTGPSGNGANFTATINISATQLRAVSGSGQSAIVNQGFRDPLVVQLLDANNQPVVGAPIAFAVTGGSAVLSSGSANTDSNGRASVTVTAGGSPGAVTVAASYQTLSASFSLTVSPLGPTLTAAGVVNAASGQPVIAPGAIIMITARNIATQVQGVVLPSSQYGPLPTTLANVRVTFGGVPAPIFYVANTGGNEMVTVQAPFEVPTSGSIPVTVFSGNTSATVTVTTAAYSPGIFENLDAAGRRYAVALRPDGSFVTPENPARRGERVRVYCTGLGATNPLAGTNAAGVPNQNVTARVIAGVNDAGVEVIAAEYAENLIGVYVVTIQVPQDTAPGSARNLSVAIDSPAGVLYSNGSLIAIQ